MVSVFDLEKLHILLKDFYEISHIRITVFDEERNELISYPSRVAPYCEIIRGTDRGIEACKACDRKACEDAVKKRSIVVYRCHAGFTEAVMPLYVSNILVGYLLFGHIFSYTDHETGWTEVERCINDLPVDRGLLKESIMKAIPMDETHIRSAATILHAVASYLIMERMATLNEDVLAARLNSYLSAHYTEKLRAETIADYLGVGKTQLYDLSKQLYNRGILAQIRSMRMDKAKELLKHSRDSISEIASQCGYDDYNYFITVFSRETGESPGAWRRKSD